MDPFSPISETPESDPFAGLGKPSPRHVEPRQSGSGVVRKVIAGLMLLAGAGILLVGALAYGEGKAAGGPLVVLGHAMIWGGLGVCTLAFALYDRRGPFAFLRRKKPD
jgi:hypothetical protein